MEEIFLGNPAFAYRAIRLVGIDNFDGFSISNQDGLGVSQPGGVEGVSANQAANGRRATL